MDSSFLQRDETGFLFFFRHGLSHTEVNILNDPALSFAVAYQQYQECMAKEMKEMAAGEYLYMKHCVVYSLWQSFDSLPLSILIFTVPLLFTALAAC
jgi:hypothetical protein